MKGFDEKSNLVHDVDFEFVDVFGLFSFWLWLTVVIFLFSVYVEQVADTVHKLVRVLCY